MFTQNYNLPRLLEKVAPHTGDNDLFQFSNMNRLQTLHTWKINCFSLCFDTERQFPRQLLTIYFLFTHFHCIVIIFDWIIFLFLFLDKESNECDSRRQRSQSIDVSSINLCRNSLPFCLFAFKFLFYFVYVLGTKTSRCGKKQRSANDTRHVPSDLNSKTAQPLWICRTNVFFLFLCPWECKICEFNDIKKKKKRKKISYVIHVDWVRMHANL